MANRFGSNLFETLSRRLSDLFHPYFLDFQNAISLKVCCRCLKEMKVSDSIKVLKGWCNGWATSCRFHEDKLLPCLFGCAGERDDLHHYLVCPHLFTLWSFLSNMSVSELPLIRWGLIDPCASNLNAVACVFSGYHAVRRHFKTINQFFEYNQHELSSAQLCCARGVFADAFKVEAGEFGIHIPKFSLQSFLNFMHVHDSGNCATLPSITGMEVVSVDGAPCNSQTDTN